MSFLNNLTSKFPFGKKSEETEYFFALNIGLVEVTAILWSINNHHLSIINQTALPYRDIDDLLEKGSLALDRALGDFPQEPKKILFGVPVEWGAEDNLKEPYLKILQKMVKEYDLEPLAYITNIQAISHLLEKQEGVPVTTILLGIGDFLEVGLIKGGKIIDTQAVRRSSRLFADVEKALLQFTEVEVLPSKILLYSTQGDNLDKTRDELMTYPWMQKLPFLHYPKIELAKDNLNNLAVVLAGAFELDPQLNIKQALSLAAGSFPKTEVSLPAQPLRRTSGFVRGDIKKEQEELSAKKEGEDLEDDNLVSPDLDGATALEGVKSYYRPDVNYPASSLPERKSFLSSKFKSFFHRLGKIFPKSSGRLHFPVVGLGWLIPVVLLLIVGLAYFFFFKALVTVFVEPKILEKDTQIVADPTKKEVDEAQKIIPGSIVETAVSGSEKASATGQKEVGSPAKGKVVIYNLTDSAVSLSTGTVLSSGNNKFTLDTTVQIASQSSSVGSDFTTVIKPGKSEAVAVTASVIGSDGNLAAGTELTVASFNKSQVLARVDEAFAGGTSKTVTVVTSDDQKKLQATLVDNLRQQAVEEIKKKLPPDKKIVPEALVAVDGKYRFNKQVNDQASEFSLTATVNFKGMAYSDTDLRTIVAKLVEVNVPTGFEMSLQDMETQADVSKVEKDGRLIFVARFKTKLLPKLDINALKKQIQGKTIAEAVSSLKTLENVIGADVKLIPNLPHQFARMPFLDQNITITISPK